MTHRPKAPRRARQALGMIVACVLLLPPLRASAQQPVVSHEGSEIFCHLLKHYEIQPISSIEDLANHRAEETLIIVFGDLRPLHAIRMQAPDLDPFAILLASDRESSRVVPVAGQPNNFRTAQLLEPWKLMSPGHPVNQNEDTAYQGKSRCPWIKTGLDVRHPVFRGVNQGLATNRPSYLFTEDSDLHLLAAFPNDCYEAEFPNRKGSLVTRNGQIGYMFGTRGDSPTRHLILAGHGVFMNGMLVQFDNDNFLFAVNTIRWLRAGPEGQRKVALMIHDGKVIESFNLPLTAPPKVPMPPVHVINQMLRELENEGIFHRFLEEAIGWPRLRQIAVLIGTLGLLVYGFYRLFLTRHQHESAPLVVGLTPPPVEVRSLLQQRQLELLALDNLWEPAQALARQWFLDHAKVEPPLWDEAESRPPPTPTFRAGWWARQQLSQQLRTVWACAVRDPTQRVRMREFCRLTELARSLTRAVQEGQLVFRDGGPSQG